MNTIKLKLTFIATLFVISITNLSCNKFFVAKKDACTCFKFYTYVAFLSNDDISPASPYKMDSEVALLQLYGVDKNNTPSSEWDALLETKSEEFTEGCEWVTDFTPNEIERQKKECYEKGSKKQKTEKEE